TEAPPGHRERDGELLAALYATPESHLERFRSVHLASGRGLADDDLLRAREVLDALVTALRDGDPDALARLRSGVVATDRESDPGPGVERPDAGKSHEPSEPSPWVRPWGQAYAPGSVPGAGVAAAGFGAARHERAAPTAPRSDHGFEG